MVLLFYLIKNHKPEQLLYIIFRYIFILKNVNVRNLPQTTAQHLAFSEMINSMLTATNQEQLTYIALTVSAEIQEREGSIYRSNFYNQRPNYYSLVLVLSS